MAAGAASSTAAKPTCSPARSAQRAAGGDSILVLPTRAGDRMDETGFIELVLSNAINREILARLPVLGLSDAWLVSGALFQTAWNRLTNRSTEYGIKDYDIFYFDLNTS